MLDQVRAALEPSLLKPQYRKPGAHPMAGHCYVASEALYHLLGGSSSGYTPTSLRVGDSIHWWLTGPKGEVLDPTADQFTEPVQYDQGRGRGFLTKQPSRRAAVVIRRAREYANL